MSTVWPTILNSSAGFVIAVSSAGFAATFLVVSFLAVALAVVLGSAGGGAAAGETTFEVWAIPMSQVYGGTTRLTSSRICDQMKRSSSIARMMFTCRST